MTETEKLLLDVEHYQSILDDAYMSERQLQYFLVLLKQYYNELMSEMKDFKATLQLGEQAVDDLDRASQEERQRMDFRASDRCRKLLKKVTAAIDRIENNDYGFCKTCGAEIGFPRLKARPTADECIQCKTVGELHEQRRGG